MMVNVEKRRLHMCTLNHIHHGNNHISHIYIAYGLGQFLIHANPHPNGTPATQAIVRPAHQALLKFTPNFFGVTYMQCTLVFTIPCFFFLFQFLVLCSIRFQIIYSNNLSFSFYFRNNTHVLSS